jgi:hypothetical protein
MRNVKWLIAAGLIAATTAACTEQYGYPSTSYNSGYNNGYYHNNGYYNTGYNNGYYYPSTANRPSYYSTTGYYYPSTASRPNYYYNSGYYPNEAYRYRDRYEQSWW